METEQIRRYLVPGDYSKIGKICGISRKYARILLDRPTAERHEEVVTAAEKIARFNLDNGIVKSTERPYL